MSDDQNTEDTTAEAAEDTTEAGGVTDESETDTEETEVADEWKPPTKEEWEQLQKAQKDAADRLAKVNKESADRRLRIKKLEQQNEDDTARAQREALEAAQARYKPIVAKSALLEAQARTDRVGALIKLIDMDRLDFDDSHEVVGLDTEVQRVRDEYPEFFIQPEAVEATKPAASPAPVAKPAPKAAVAPKPVAKRDLSPGEILAARILGTEN